MSEFWAAVFGAISGIVVLIILIKNDVKQQTTRSPPQTTEPPPPREECVPPWINPKFDELRTEFKRKLYGQHLIPGPVLKNLQIHYNDRNKPAKALVLFFHGSTGTGKNYVSNMIINKIYKKGSKSRFVKQFYPAAHFDEDNLITKNQLRNEIESRVKRCSRSTFVFDEIDEMPEGLLDVIKPYIDFHEEVDGVDYRQATFILLRNDFNRKVVLEKLMQLEKRGYKREEVELGHFENVLSDNAFRSYGGLSNSTLVTRALISAYVPFLPLEKKHVEMCIRDEFKKYNQDPSQDQINKLLKEHSWIPKDKETYSESGCKWVHDKVKHYL